MSTGVIAIVIEFDATKMTKHEAIMECHKLISAENMKDIKCQDVSLDTAYYYDPEEWRPKSGPK